jgi:hypothetical protein
MWRRLLVLDLVLALAFAYALTRIRRSWQEFDLNHGVQMVQAEKETIQKVPTLNLPATVSEDWTEISAKDPFSFDRNDVAIVAPKPTAPSQPKPVLFGTMAIGKEWIAMLAPAQGGNRGSQPVKVGESIGEWHVVEIREKSVIVAGENGLQQTVGLNEATAQGRSSERTSPGQAPAPVTLVSPSAPVSAQPAGTPNSPGTPVTPPAPAAGEANKPKILLTPFGPVPRTDP